MDTSVAIKARDGDPLTYARLAQLPALPAISIVTWVELEGGIGRDPLNNAVRRQRLDELLSRVDIHAFDRLGAEAYGRIVAAVGFNRRKVLDRMIAATAIAHGATLVTANGADFADVPGILLEAWG